MKPKDPDYQAPERVAARMRATLDLHRAGVRMMWAKFEHEYPNDTQAQRLDRLNAWLQRPHNRPNTTHRAKP